MCKLRQLRIRRCIYSYWTHIADSDILDLSGEGSSNNYAYLVVDDKSKDAVIIDPANPEE